MAKLWNVYNQPKTTTSYLQENLNHLAAILAPVRTRYDISHEDKDDSRIFHIKMTAGAFSGVYEAFAIWMANNNIELKKGDEIRVFADTAIYADKDLTSLNSVTLLVLLQRLSASRRRCYYQHRWETIGRE